MPITSFQLILCQEEVRPDQISRWSSFVVRQESTVTARGGRGVPNGLMKISEGGEDRVHGIGIGSHERSFVTLDRFGQPEKKEAMEGSKVERGGGWFDLR